MVSIVTAICLGVCLSAACGLRVFLPFLVVSIAAKCGMLELRDSWLWIGSWPALIAFSTATVVEITAYYVPWLDNALDSIATPAAGIAGTLMTVAVMPADMSPLYTWCTGIIVGGGVATSVRLVAAGARPPLNSRDPFILVNHRIFFFFESLGSVGISVWALSMPIIVSAIVMILFYVMFYLTYTEGGKSIFESHDSGNKLMQ
ncbi:MAG: DUF4126 domain-containing protein [Victivallales bacterium]